MAPHSSMLFHLMSMDCDNTLYSTWWLCAGQYYLFWLTSIELSSSEKQPYRWNKPNWIYPRRSFMLTPI